MKPWIKEELIKLHHAASMNIDNLIDQARIGMIPEDDFIKLWEDAPDNADSVCIVYGVMSDGWNAIVDEYAKEWYRGPINRPTPAYIPKLGDKVWVWYQFTLSVGIIESCVCGGVTFLVRRNGELIKLNINELRPYQESQISWSWEQIKGEEPK